MKLLLDTHIVLWMLSGHERFPREVREAILTSEMVFVSAASFWEIAIKASLSGFSEMSLPDHWQREFQDQFKTFGVRWLPIDPEHCRVVQDLPFHHRDPFDRMLIAQAKVEGLAVASVDKAFRDYGVEIVC